MHLFFLCFISPLPNNKGQENKGWQNDDVLGGVIIAAIEDCDWEHRSSVSGRTLSRSCQQWRFPAISESQQHFLCIAPTRLHSEPLLSLPQRFCFLSSHFSPLSLSSHKCFSHSLSQYAYILLAIPLMLISTPNYTQTVPFEGSANSIRFFFLFTIAVFPWFFSRVL